jgi:hypothetical protein
VVVANGGGGFFVYLKKLNQIMGLLFSSRPLHWNFVD